ncbi:MAG: 30S ribosomal protein S20 [Candidatus Cloacimonadota bacterium]|nr:MAG: 30S ribosomal protein S20 [Candidatus Cloacimonadota bacterium]
MANLASVAKRARQAEKRRLRNAPLRARMRSVKKKVSVILESKNIEEIRVFIPQALRTFDKLVTKNILRKQTAARYKSRIMAKVNVIDPEFVLPKITGLATKEAPEKKVVEKKVVEKKAPVKEVVAEKAPAKKTSKKAATKKED